MIYFLLFNCIVLSMRSATTHGIFVHHVRFELVLKQVVQHSPNSPQMHRKASPRQAPACIISCIVLFASPFDKVFLSFEKSQDFEFFYCIILCR